VVENAQRDSPQKGRAGQAFMLSKEHLPEVIRLLSEDYDVIAPSPGDAAIVLERIDSATNLAINLVDKQSPGEYKLTRGHDKTFLSFTNGPESPKKFLHPSRLTLFSGTTGAEGFALTEHAVQGRPFAFFAVRPCDLQAIHVLDKVFLSSHADAYYRRLREGAFMLALNCTQPGGTCFCASMGTGPRAERGYDLRMTELPEEFLLESGSEAGASLLQRLPIKPARDAAVREADRLLTAAVANMGRTLDTEHLPQVLRSQLESPVWDIMKDWCLGCTNCTIVCPTCFCYNTADAIDLKLRGVARERFWDSCFTWQFAEVHGGNFRSDLRARYRHWLCHKLSYWVEQYGVFGCVGCGRCITWCPVKIDITEVAKAVRRHLT